MYQAQIWKRRLGAWRGGETGRRIKPRCGQRVRAEKAAFQPEREWKSVQEERRLLLRH